MKEAFLSKKFTATGIGSLPFVTHQEACQFVKEVFKDDIVFWPQLVKSSFLENMYAQFSEGLPGVKIDKDKKKIYVDTQAEDYQQQLELSLEHYLNNDLDYFAITKNYAQGFHTILEDNSITQKEYFKGQITGPISFGLTLKEVNDRSIIYNPELYQVLVKVLSMKVRWQIQKIKSKNSKLKVIIFIDEPYLVSVGSSFVSLKKEDIIKDLDEIIDTVHQEGALAGVHCCGNTDWSILLKTKIDVLNFDAFNYLDNLLIFQEELNLFLNNGGILAWGIVPTSQQANEDKIENNLLETIQDIAKKKKLFDNPVLITPSCGTGTVPVELAKKIHILTVKITDQLNKNKI